MNCRSCGHPKWRHETPLGCESVLSPDGERFEPCRCRSWINREEPEVTSSDIGVTSSDISDGGIGAPDADSSRPHDICGSDCWCNPTVETVTPMGSQRFMQWRHAPDCVSAQKKLRNIDFGPCDCGLATVQTLINSGEPVRIEGDVISSLLPGREEWWLSLIRGAEEAEAMYSGGDWAPAVSVARRVADSLEED